MAINNSVIGNIARGGIRVNSKFFSFINNIVTQVDSKGFDVTALTTRLVNNTWKTLGAEAFSEIKPNGSCLLGNVYEFRDNEIQYFENGFAPNMQAFNNCKCSHISFSHNIFPCENTCNAFKTSNINPVNYKELLNPFTNFTNDNTCKGSPSKSVKESMIEIGIECGLIPTPTLPEPSTTELSTTELAETTTDVPVTLEITTTSDDEVITASAYKEARLVLPLSVGGLLLIVGAVAATFWVYKKRKEMRKTTVASYHHTSRNFDQDQLIDDLEDDREEDAITIQAI